MADSSRASGFLPTIKCSSCARDIEISQMGEHVCGPSAGEPTPPPDTYGNFDRMPYGQGQENQTSYAKPTRAAPPKVDTYAANRPFIPQELTPVSASPSRSASPVAPRIPFGHPVRSATAPIQRGPPSPELLSSNLDCAFPPFPTAKVVTQPRRPQQDGGFTGGNNLYAEPDQMYAPVSPRMESSQGVLQRMNTIAPGPFDVKKRQRPSERAQTSHQRAGSLRDATMSTRTAGTPPNIIRPMNGHSRSSTSSSNDSKSGLPTHSIPRADGYGGFGPPTTEDSKSQAENRSQTYPPVAEARDPFRRPSVPTNDSSGSNGNWPMEDTVSPKSSPSNRRRPSLTGPDLSRPPPPRGVSLIRPNTAPKTGDGRLVPELNIADEFGIGNPYHTPSESQSSNGSTYSERSKASSRSSPPRPSTSHSTHRRPSNVNQVDNLMSDLQSSMKELQPRQILPNPSPPRKRAPPPALNPVPRFGPSLHSPESPMDPAMQRGRLSPNPQRDQDRQPGSTDARNRSPARRPSRPGTARSNCKSCGDVIKGKSISSADGRLTGRYHKHCFVCKTCSEPFQTSTFYVIDDAPYCERHYHKLNGSVCKTCDRGIEGQYLESESKQKFHPTCLSCSDCRRNLRNEYFEMNGRVYCERDAFRRAQHGRNLGIPNAGTNKMERRTTRLMMM